MVYHMILYTCKEVKTMSNRNRKKKKEEKSESAFKSWLVSALTDLLVGIILLILDKIIN